jgi:hypothetical protein
MLHRGLVPVPSGWIPARCLPCKNQASDRSEIPALCGINVPRDTTSLRLDGVAGSLPKVAPQAAQPWALRRNPVGIQNEPNPPGFFRHSRRINPNGIVSQSLGLDQGTRAYPRMETQRNTQLQRSCVWVDGGRKIRHRSVTNLLFFQVREFPKSFKINLPSITIGA